MSLEKNKAIARKATEEFTKRNLSLLYELIAPDIVLYERTLQLRGLENFKQFLTMTLKGFPDLHVTIEDMIAEGG
ncbi:MAG: ester cyclase [Candidatus Bathyarchaeia archaeon]